MTSSSCGSWIFFFKCNCLWLITKKSIPLYTKEQGQLDDMVRVVQENVTGYRSLGGTVNFSQVVIGD